MSKFASIILCLALFIHTGAGAHAQATGSWAELDPDFGSGAAVCNTSGSYYSCFSLRCHPVVGLEFAFFYNVGTYEPDPVAKVFVDGNEYWSLSMATVEEGSELALKYAARVHSEFLEALQSGSQLVFDPGFRHTFGLAGSSKAIAEVLDQCPVVEEAAAAVPTTNTSLYFNTDLPGFDYEMGTTNPALKDVTWQQCHDICLADTRCNAFTHNGTHDICFLKEGTGQSSPFDGATSGIITSRAPPSQVNPLEGKAATMVAGLHWQEGSDDEAVYTARIRAAAVGFGGDCKVERAEMERVAATLSVSARETGTHGDGKLSLNWTAEPLSRQMPLYLVVATDSGVRFSGTGFFALTANSISPFGIEAGRAFDRAIVPLHAEGLLGEGSFELVPLVAKPLTIAVSLVGYLRSCQKELVLAHQEIEHLVTPGDPVITLRNPAGVDAMPSSIELPDIDRLIRFNGTRYVISDMDFNEIVTGDGSDVSLSPTGRYVAVRSNEGFDIIDPFDGATIVSMIGRDLAWANNDSFAISELEPYGRVSIAQPLAGRMVIADQSTSCASCLAMRDAVIDINLESNFAIAAGGLGYGLASLTDPERTVGDGNLIVFDEGLKGSRPAYENFITALGALAPFSLDKGINAPLGLTLTHGSEFIVGDLPQVAPRDYVTSISASTVELEPAPAGARTMLDALDEMGMPLLAADSVGTTIRPFPLSYDDPGYDAALADYGQAQASVRDAISHDVQAAGSSIEWLLPSGDMMEDLYCSHFAIDERRLRLAGDIDNAFRFELDDKVIWAFRALCEGGPTYSTLTWSSYFAVLDTSAIPLTGSELVVDDFHTFGNRGDVQTHERDFQIKSFSGRFIALFVPSKGRVKLFDLADRSVVIELARSPRGDLLKDVHLDASTRFLLIENADGTLAVYRLADGQLVIEGRFVDNELVIWTPDYFFDGTTEGTEFVQLRFPGKDGEYSLQQFASTLQLPGLLSQVLDGTAIRPKPTIEPPPEISASIALVGGAVEIQTGVNVGTAAASLLVYQDGQLTDTLAVGADELKSSVARVPGARWVTVVGQSSTGLLSAPVSVDLGPEAGVKPVVRYLGVGIDYYSDPALDSLNFAKQDVIKLQSALASLDGDTVVLEGGLEDMLTDRFATKDSILAAAEGLAADTVLGQTAVFLFSGHGLRGEDGRFYMALSGTDVSDIEATALAWDDLAAVLARSEGRILVLLDACRSSAAGSGVFATNDDAAAGLTGAFPSGLVVLSASKGRETSGESFEIQGGVFTEAVAMAISASRAEVDLNGNGAVEVTELYRFVRAEVVELRQGKQTPWLTRSQLIGDFALF